MNNKYNDICDEISHIMFPDSIANLLAKPSDSKDYYDTVAGYSMDDKVVKFQLKLYKLLIGGQNLTDEEFDQKLAELFKEDFVSLSLEEQTIIVNNYNNLIDEKNENIRKREKENE